MLTLAEFYTIMPVTVTHMDILWCLWQHVTVLALATLGGATKNRNDPICVALSKVAKTSMIMWLSRVAVANSFANKLRQCKQSIMDLLELQCFLFVLLWNPWYSCCWQAPRSVWLILVLGISKKHNKVQHIRCYGLLITLGMYYQPNVIGQLH